MPTIDADAHVIETDRTWDYMDEADRRFRPVTLVDPSSGKELVMIDGRIVRERPKFYTSDTGEGAAEMPDIATRLRHMDELGVDIQVLYPTIFLRVLTKRPEVELALCRSYNRWMADIWAQGKGRLRWAAVLPLLTMEEALRELRTAHQHGACAVFMRGVEGDRLLSDPYFFPLYEEASRLDIPICVHASAGNLAMYELFAPESGFAQFKLPVVGAFHTLISMGVPELFPRLRFGFIEVTSQWVPYAIHDLRRRFEKLRGKRLPEDLLRAYRFYVACETDDDLPYVLPYTGAEHLVIGTDYGHKDTSSEIEALRNLRKKGEIDPAVITKILDDNARALYGL